MEDSQWVPNKAIEELTLKRALAKVENNLSLASDLFRECAPIAAMSICHLAVHSPTEAIRLNAAKHVVDRAMGTPATTKMDDTSRPVWEELFESIAANQGE